MLAGINLSKFFSHTAVLDELSISLKPGLITALIGPTGAGKTTLLRALAMVDPPDRGSIQIGQMSFHFPCVTRISKGPWPTVGVVFQDLFLWPHLTNRENILLPLRLNKIHDALDRMEAIISELEVAEFLDRYPNEVSRGQRQTVAIARALALEPQYLLMDEITASLDIGRAARLANALRLRADRGMAVMVITHQLSFARTRADRFAFMDRGRIVEEGDPSLLETPRTESLQSFLKMVGQVV